MSQSTPSTTPNQPAEKTCKYLLSKGMFVTGQRDLGNQSEIGDGYCWCAMTQHALGPDNQNVDRGVCNASRKCYVQVL